MKLYNSLNEYFRNTFGCKVHKISINADMTCPNRDGTLSTDGCIFCDEVGSAAIPARPEIPILTQLDNGKRVMSQRYKAKKFLAYFQAFTNTYAPADVLEKLYRTAIEDDDVVGLVVGTRPDCISKEVLKVLADIAKEKYVQIEFGIQTIHDKSLAYLNRHHTFASFTDAVQRTREYPEIKIGAHVILGIPGETEPEMIQTAVELSNIGIDIIKIHQLHVIKGTRLEELYDKGEYTPMTADEYVTLLVTFLEHLSEDIVVDRLIGDRSHDVLVAPRWSIKKRVVLNMIENELKNRNSHQGAKYEG